ncbi:Hypothetical predicted protein [Octopus vulgaris]|uniref:Migration and invasion enhancer 1 n=1 Tax=Octopus vulgaris TaxID=6645 RepID=A0AA36FJ96_OCTVU|nr:Hypothetical predicted protein [Octopus vulgaris]
MCTLNSAIPEAMRTGISDRTAAFEVTINDKLVFSRLQSFSFPSSEQIVNLLHDVQSGKTIPVIEETSTGCTIISKVLFDLPPAKMSEHRSSCSTFDGTEKSSVSQTEKSSVSQTEKSSTSRTEKSSVSQPERSSVSQRERSSMSEKHLRVEIEYCQS